MTLRVNLGKPLEKKTREIETLDPDILRVPLGHWQPQCGHSHGNGPLNLKGAPVGPQPAGGGHHDAKLSVPARSQWQARAGWGAGGGFNSRNTAVPVTRNGALGPSPRRTKFKGTLKLGRRGWPLLPFRIPMPARSVQE